MIHAEVVSEGKAVDSKFCVQVPERVLKKMFTVRLQLQHSAVIVKHFQVDDDTVDISATHLIKLTLLASFFSSVK